MATKRDPFDLSDISDLPEDIRKAMKTARKIGSIESRSLDLIGRAGKSLTCAELRAAFYRVHGVELTRAQGSNAMLNLCRQHRVRRTAVGQYASLTTADEAAE